MSCKAIVADDEKELRTYLKTLLAAAWPELVVCGEARNGREALALVETESPQVVFLDIRMPGLSGLEVAKQLAGRCHIVFVTAYDQHAVEAFERDVVDYLVKPVSPQRLMQTVQRLKNLLAVSPAPAAELSAAVERVLAGLKLPKVTDFLQWIRVPVKESVRLIPVRDVAYFQAQDKYTLVMIDEGEALIRKNIRELAAELDPGHFWQIHRGTIVNVSRIERVSRSVTGRGVLRLKGRPEPLTVSRNYLHLFKQM